MPREHRQIIFAEDELLSAMIAHDRTLESKVIEGEAVACAVGAGPIVELESRVRDGNVWRNQKISLPLEFVLHSLIRYCLENNIMIPRAGRKTVALNDGDVCLEISIGERK